MCWLSFRRAEFRRRQPRAAGLVNVVSVEIGDLPEARNRAEKGAETMNRKSLPPLPAREQHELLHYRRQRLRAQLGP